MHRMWRIGTVHIVVFSSYRRSCSFHNQNVNWDLCYRLQVIYRIKAALYLPTASSAFLIPICLQQNLCLANAKNWNTISSSVLTITKCTACRCWTLCFFTIAFTVGYHSNQNYGPLPKLWCLINQLPNPQPNFGKTKQKYFEWYLKSAICHCYANRITFSAALGKQKYLVLNIKLYKVSGQYRKDILWYQFGHHQILIQLLDMCP